MNRAIIGLLLLVVAMVGFFGIHSYRRQQQEDRDHQRTADAAAARGKLDEEGRALEASVAAMGLQSSLRTHGIETRVTATRPGVLAVQGRAKDKVAIKKLLDDPAHAALLRDEKITAVIFKDETGSESMFTVN